MVQTPTVFNAFQALLLLWRGYGFIIDAVAHACNAAAPTCGWSQGFEGYLGVHVTLAI